MSDYRDPYNRDPLDPAAAPATRSEPEMRSDMRRSNSGLGWIAGAVFLIVVLALIFGLGRSDRTASTGGSPPTTTTGASPPAGPATAPRTTTGQGQ
ncbi:MAG: hypothetical protein ACJ8D4_06185 [Xanthobacteraceae bacterium]